VPIENILHVGDDYEADCSGARALGFKTVWITEQAWSADSHPDADAAMATIAGLPALLSGNKGWCGPGEEKGAQEQKKQKL
jgi:FMN phosphatase YigB (HAD superfamily)